MENKRNNRNLTSPTTTTASPTPAFAPLKIVRNLSLKRMKGSSGFQEKVKLDRVLGLTLSHNSAFSASSPTGCVAYPAGCVVVLLDVRRNKQSHIVNASKKPITSLSYSADGKYIVTGECGHQPSVRVWDAKSCSQIAELDGHKYGVTCVSFSPSASFVVSIGSQHDMSVNVWDWKNNMKVASNKVSAKVKALSFSEDGSYFVTAGVRHVKFWYLDNTRSQNVTEPVPLMGRSAILGDQRNNVFCDVGCGIVRVFNPSNLHFICTLPRPHALGTDLSRITPRPDPHSFTKTKYADTVAIALIEDSKKVTCVYNDHSMYVWDVRDFKKVGKTQSYLYHSACIWGIEVSNALAAKSLSHDDIFFNSHTSAREDHSHFYHQGLSLTCSSDDTIRVWNLESNQNFDGYVYKRNIFSHDLLKILYTDPEMKYICETESGCGPPESAETGYDGKNGVRCLKISPDGVHLASGDRSGNINVKDLTTQVDVCKIEAHDSEVLCLEYSDAQTCGGHYLLCSASRDRLIHLFDVNQQYSFVQTLDDHNSAITAIRFVPDKSSHSLQLLSCGADKSLIFRRMSTQEKGTSFVREHHVVGKTTLYDMELDHEKTAILTACQDRQIRVYSVESGKLASTIKGTQSEEGTLIKIAMDPSGQYFATSSTDKSLCIFDYKTGECVASASGHSELITGLKFSVNGRTLISVSGDGCIFVWKLPNDVANAISLKLGLPPVPPEKPAFISALRPHSSDGAPDANGHKSSTLPSIPKIRLENNMFVRQISDSSSKRTELNSISRITREKSGDSEYDSMFSGSREGKGDDRDTDSCKTLSVRSDEETPSGSDIVYYPQDDDSLQRNSFEIRTDGLSFQTTGNPASSRSLKNSVSVPNFNDLHSDEDEKDGSEKSSHVLGVDVSHRVRNPLYASNENLNPVRRSLHNKFESEDEDKDVNRSSLSSRFMSRGAVVVTGGRATTPSRDMMSLSRSTSVSSLSGNKRREELSKAVGEARRRLESLGWNTSLTSSKSVADLRHGSRAPRLSSALQTASDVVTRSCSMSDLNFPPKRIFQPNNAPTPAPVWDQNRSERDLSQAGTLKKSTSISSLIKSNSRTRVQGRCSGLWGSPGSQLQVTPGRRSGRASAPPQRVRVNGNLHETQSSDDESSTDDESSSSFIRTLRPGTPPKPSILRQVRRSSTSHVVPNTMPKQSEAGSARSGRTRKLWDNFELRSSKMNPATIDLTRDTCEQAIEELNFMAIFVRKLFKDGVSSTYQTLAAVKDPHSSGATLRLPPKSFPSQVPDEIGTSSTVTMNLLQQYSDRLMSIVEQRMSKDSKSSTDLYRDSFLSMPCCFSDK